MADTTHITYLFDPLCGWCYGASAKLEQLAARPDIALQLVPTGLFSGVGGRPMDAEFCSLCLGQRPTDWQIEWAALQRRLPPQSTR